MKHHALMRDFVRGIIEAHALTIRDIEGGEDPFVYSSGNRGPGYLMFKGLVSQRSLLTAMVHHLAFKTLSIFPDVEYVAGNATGGMVPGWVMAEALSTLTGREVPYFYVRNTRKIGGHGELLTGDKNNNFFVPGRRGLVFEELVNFAQTTTNSAIVQREAGYDVRFGATLVSYDQPRTRALLDEAEIELVHLFSVKEILDIAEGGNYEKRLVDDYRAFLTDPIGWQLAHGIEPPKKEETHA